LLFTLGTDVQNPLHDNGLSDKNRSKRNKTNAMIFIFFPKTVIAWNKSDKKIMRETAEEL
jgi:hypothetical protein